MRQQSFCTEVSDYHRTVKIVRAKRLDAEVHWKHYSYEKCFAGCTFFLKGENLREIVARLDLPKHYAPGKFAEAVFNTAQENETEEQTKPLEYFSSATEQFMHFRSGVNRSRVTAVVHWLHSEVDRCNHNCAFYKEGIQFIPNSARLRKASLTKNAEYYPPGEYVAVAFEQLAQEEQLNEEGVHRFFPKSHYTFDEDFEEGLRTARENKLTAEVHWKHHESQQCGINCSFFLDGEQVHGEGLNSRLTYSPGEYGTKVLMQALQEKSNSPSPKMDYKVRTFTFEKREENLMKANYKTVKLIEALQEIQSELEEKSRAEAEFTKTEFTSRVDAALEQGETPNYTSILRDIGEEAESQFGTIHRYDYLHIRNSIKKLEMVSTESIELTDGELKELGL